MADQQEQECYERRHEESNRNVEGHEQVKERGIFDLLGGKKEGDQTEQQKPVQEDHQVIATEFEKAHLASDDHRSEKKVEEEEEERKPSLIEKLHRTSSGSSSDEEEEEGGEKKKKKEKKKGLKDDDDHEHNIEDQTYNAPCDHGEEKKGFMEKIKEKLPGHHKDHGEEK